MNEELNESMRFYLESLKEEYRLYTDLFELTKSERKAIEVLQMRDLGQIIEQKQTVLDKVSVVDKRIANLRDVWKEAKDLIEPALSRDIRQFLEEFSAFMKKLVEYESENEKIFIEKNKAKEQELSEIRRAKKVNRAYFKKPEGPPRKTDISI